MEYIVALSSQGRIFLYSLGFGFILGMLYDVFRLVRVAIPLPKMIFAVDFVYFVFGAFLSFLFMLIIDSGQLRLSSGMGELIGFSVYYFTCGVIFRRFTSKMAQAIKRIVLLVFKPIAVLRTKISEALKKSSKIFKKSSKKAVKNKNLSCKTI